MLRISTANLKPGMIVGKNIFSADGQLLLSAGITLNQPFIDRLKQLDISSVYIQNNCIPDVEIPEILREETRVQAVQSTQKFFKKLHTSGFFKIEEIHPTVQSIVAEIVQNRQTMVHLTDIRLYDDYTFSHSVNVCALSTILALSMDYNQARLEELALGALLHDVGKTCIPLNILNKPGRLTDEEMAVMRNHSELGFELLRKSFVDMSVVPMHVAYQHQEKFDGSGYPRGLKQTEIHEYARIVAIADVYDALTSDRPYRKGMAPHEAYDIMLGSANMHFDAKLLANFITHIAIYPIGSIVQLNTGDYAVVISVPQNRPFYPVVKLIADSQKRRFTDRKEMALEDNTSVFIYRVLAESEFLSLCDITSNGTSPEEDK